jgi:hypothetical protein
MKNSVIQSVSQPNFLYSASQIKVCGVTSTVIYGENETVKISILDMKRAMIF